ncbi:MAG: hypothetical protein IJ829_07930, partial [Kiritimatiellae bacterium]|nr:hypothetical protein [Kiritimatiellia bacterium]
LALALAAAARAGDEADAADGADFSRDWYAELSASSRLFSLGSVRSEHAVWQAEGDVVQHLPWRSHLLAGYWQMSDLERQHGSGHRSQAYECDPYLFVGHRLDIADGWCLTGRAGMIWVLNEGYKQDTVHLIREWTFRGELATPLLVCGAEVRQVDGLGTYLRLTAQRDQSVFDGLFTLTPHLAASGGSSRWNAARNGHAPGVGAVGTGLTMTDYGLRCSLPVGGGFALFADVVGCTAIDVHARDQIKARRRHGATLRADTFFFLAGATWSF